MDSRELRGDVSLEQTASPERWILPLNGSASHEIEPARSETQRADLLLPQSKRVGTDLFSPPNTTAQAELALGAKGKRANSRDITAPPCFFSNLCHQRAAVEKAGRTVCRECAKARLQGIEYPLRGSEIEPLYLTGRAASEALDMMEDISRRARRRLRGGTWG